MKKSNLIKLLFSLILTNLAGYLGSLFTTPAIRGWYATLNRPSLAPPNWIFAPVWTILFILMAVAFYLVIKDWRSDKTQRLAVCFFAIQLVLNTFWSILFFGLNRIDLALVEIFILLLFIILTAIQFAKIKKWAAYLLLPYIGWVMFAAFLNFSFWRLN